MCDFNSIKVRLNQGAEHYYESFEGNFNSIKVRLNPCTTASAAYSPPFQFHKGTIKPKLFPCFHPIPIIFQFHKGTIKPSDKNI